MDAEETGECHNDTIQSCSRGSSSLPVVLIRKVRALNLDCDGTQTLTLSRHGGNAEHQQTRSGAATELSVYPSTSGLSVNGVSVR